MGKWREYKLTDLADIHNTKRIPLSKMERLKMQGAYPYYGASGIVDYVNDYKFDGEFVLISEDGENLKTRKTPIAFKVYGKFWVNNHAHIIKGKKDYLNDLLIYFFANLDLNQYITGAVQPKLSKSSLLEIPIYLPESEEEQKAIAEVLSSLDDKIDLLHRQNKTLEALAQTIFREWFIEGADEGWEECKLGDFGKVVTGKTPSTKNSDYWGNEIYFITPTDFKYYGKYSTFSDRKLSIAGMEKVKSSVLPKDSILVTCIGSDMGKVAISQNQCITNQQINSLIINNPLNLEYVYQYLKYSYPLLRAIAMGGTTMPIINKTDFENIEIPLPTNDLIKKFYNITLSSNEKIIKNTKQIKTLENLRDTLLPKLMSGEVRVRYD